MAKYLITGGYGFIGSHLIDALLLRGDSVRILDNLSTGKVTNVAGEHEFIQGDVGDNNVVKEAMEGVQGCFHLAAIASVEKSNQDWSKTHQSNQTGTVNVFDAARQNPTIPVVYASSAAVYGDNTNIPLAESEPISPLTAYGADKAGSELHGRVATLVHGVPTVGLRFFNVFGPRQDPSSAYSGVISIFLDRTLRGKGVTIFGDGEQTRDFIYVTDVVAHLLAAMELKPTNPQVFNVCTGKSISLKIMLENIFTITGKKISVSYGPARLGDIRQSEGLPTMATENLEVKAQVEFKNGLADLIKSKISE
ncbi:MAG: NAD-dependent epimerase/dehydratase family protein [Magnetococcales bacterium]|nr:NAD-dependent epimerase/dehydratase family protein [Magnetococcales bacterium]